jgi:hypothetical protein
MLANLAGPVGNEDALRWWKADLFQLHACTTILRTYTRSFQRRKAMMAVNTKVER